MAEITKQRILNVDDDDAGRHAVSHILKQAGFEVMEAATGAEALSLATRHPDLILLNRTLPDMSGFEVCRQIKSDPRTSSTPVLHLSSTHDSSQDPAPPGTEGGADGYLRQPVQPQILVAMIRALLRLRATEAALRESEDRYRDLVENSQDLICTHDLQGRLLSVNAAAVRITGYSRAALLGMNLTDLLTRGSRAGFAAYLAEIAAKGQASGLMRIRTAAGETRWWEFNNTLRSAGVTTPVVRGMVQDITERKRAEDALRESEARFRATFEQAAVGITQVAPDGRWLRVNQKLCDILGYTREELLAGRFQDITHPDDLGRDLEHLRLLLADEIANYSTEKRYVHKNGTVIWAHLTVALVRQDSGQPDYFISVIEDITERKHGQQELVDSEERFRGLVEQSLIGIYLSDGVGVHYINPRGEEILGYDTGTLTGVSLTPLVIDEDRPRLVHDIRRLVKGEIDVIRMDFRVLRKDGSKVTIGGQIIRTHVDGRPAVICMMQDISEKRGAEAEIKRYITELESAFMSTVVVATSLSELRDPYTAGHERRVGEIAVAIGAELGFDARRQEGLRVAGYLHDIGKITIPTEILSKPGKLNPIEFRLIQGHPQSGYDVLKDVKFPWPVAQVALQHHERMDGSGYPHGLKGEAILLEARILAVADVIEAMSSHRPYRVGLGVDKALAEIERGRGSVYDTEVVDACLRLFGAKRYQLPA